MPNGNQRPGASSRVVTRQGNNSGFDELESVPYQANGERPIQLVRDAKMLYLHCWVTARVTVAGVGGAPTVVENGFADIVDRIRTRLLGDSLWEHSGRDFLEIGRRASATVLDYDDGGFDPTSAADYELFFEFLVPLAQPWMAQPFDFHVRARRTEDEVREALVRFSNAAENAGDDQGTGVLVTGGTQTLTWAREPELFVGAEVVPPNDRGGGPLPAAYTKAETFESEVFTAAQSGLTIDFTPDAPVTMVLLQGFDDGEPADLLERVTVADHQDYFDLPIELLRIAERQRFQAVETTVDHSIGILLAGGGRWTNRFRPGVDSRKQRIRVDTAAPAGDGRIRVIAVTGVRKNVGIDVREELRPAVQPTG